MQQENSQQTKYNKKIVQIPTRIIEKLITHRIAGEETKVLMYVIRNTYGWHREWTNLKDMTKETLNLKAYRKNDLVIKMVLNNILLTETINGVDNYKVNENLDTWLETQKRANIT